MASTSTVPRVAVKADGTGGFAVTCTACPGLDVHRVMRIDADLAATGHVRTHARPWTEEQEARP